MLYLYLDESGDLGFDFVNKKPSKYFIVVILAIEGEFEKRHIAKMVRRTLHKKINIKTKRKRIVQELKGTSTTLEVKKYLLGKIRGSKFSVSTLILNKKRVYPDLIKDKSRIYNWVARLLLDNIDLAKAKTRVRFILDKSKSKREIEEFNGYIVRHLEGKINPQIPLEIEHLDSTIDLCLNVADLFAWGVQRKYERKDLEWYNYFKNKIKYETLYLP